MERRLRAFLRCVSEPARFARELGKALRLRRGSTDRAEMRGARVPLVGSGFPLWGRGLGSARTHPGA